MKHILAVVVWAFCCGMVAGFYICFFTLFRRALTIAKDCVATSNECIVVCEKLENELSKIVGYYDQRPRIIVTHSTKKERIQ